MSEYAATVDEREGLEEFSSFMGLRNNVDAASMGRGDLVDCINCDILDDLGVSRRKGFSSALTTAIDRSLWASGDVCLGVGSNSLKLVNPDYTTKTLLTGLTAERPLSYTAVGDRVFWSNGAQKGVVQDGANRSWGIDVPDLAAVTAGPGSLLPGLYQYAVTYLRSDGQESGASLAGTITLTAAGGIELTAIAVSTDPSVSYKAIYASSVGGETLYQAGVIANAATAFAIREPRMGASPLLTQFLQPPPAGEHIAYQNGYMLVANGVRLYPSEPYAPELFDYRKALPFLGRVTMVAPVKGGVWIGLDNQVGWLSGDTPEAWDFKVVADYGVIPGTLWFADAGVIGDGQATGEMVALFASKRGLCTGFPGGRLVNLTESRFAYPVMDVGAGIVRRHRGTNQFLVTLQGTETAGNIAT
ncbi:MAG: hypothetical protein PHW66_09615 [Gallionella sp.]|nr:hypothetical protein [Gallionella sp.]